MKKLLLALALTAASHALHESPRALAQTPAPAAGQQTSADPGITPNGVIGEVAAIDASAKQLFLKTDAGSVVIVTVADNTNYVRLPPGETTLAKATKTALSEIGAGDRVFARGSVAADSKSMMARVVIVNTKADLERKHEADRAEWKARGVVGTVTAVNPQTKEITLQSRTPGAPPVVIAASDAKVKFRRYAPDSVRFSDAKAGTFEEIKVGDQLRAKGEKSPDGARFTPEEVVTGSFRTLMGTITAVNPETREIQIKTLQGNQPVTIVVSKDSSLKRVPPEAAAMMAGGAPGSTPPQGAGGGAAARPAGAQAAAPPAGGAPPAAGAPGGGGGGMVVRRMGGDMQEMIERLPAATLAELKPGSMVVFSTTGTSAERVTAIQLIAGIEPLVAMMQARPGAGGANRGGNSLANLNLGFGIGQP
ncbi:MAG TPA: hypothetical protein VGB73_19035 [Pyrinomonadaceae bacterium]|jgi:hypothetical protein